MKLALALVFVLAAPTGAQDLSIPKTRRTKRSAPSSLPQDLQGKGPAPTGQSPVDMVKPLEEPAPPEPRPAAAGSGSQTDAPAGGGSLYVSPAPSASEPAPSSASLRDVEPVHGAVPAVSEAPSGDEKATRLLSEAHRHYKAQEWQAAAQKATDALNVEDTYEGRMLRAGANLRLMQVSNAGSRDAAALAAQAEADARAATEKKPASGAAQFYLAWSLFKSGKFQDALHQAERAKQVDATNAQNRFLLAALHDRFGNRPRALEEIETAGQLDPRFRERAAEAARGGKIRYEADETGSVKDDLRVVASWLQTLRELLGTAAFVGLGLLFAAALAGLGWILGPKAAAPQRRPVAEAPSAPTGAVPAGLLAGKYEMIRVIGRGGMGDVLEARDQSLGRTVAIKRMSTRLSDVGAQGRDLMLQEARTVADLHHPAIVDVFDVIEEGEMLFLVFEFVSGKTVQHMLAEQRRLSVERTIEILKPVCQALDFAHSRDIVHRDLKPSNIMVTNDGYPKLMDFGIARRMADRVPEAAVEKQAQARSGDPSGLDFVRTRTIVGTPLYMAPEMEQGIVCKESDVYSLGVCVYEMITGDRPFMEPATAFQKIQMDFMKPSLRIPELPPAIDDVITAALQAAPEQRIHGAKEFLDRLRAAAKLVATQE